MGNDEHKRSWTFGASLFCFYKLRMEEHDEHVRSWTYASLELWRSKILVKKKNVIAETAEPFLPSETPVTLLLSIW